MSKIQEAIGKAQLSHGGVKKVAPKQRTSDATRAKLESMHDAKTSLTSVFRALSFDEKDLKRFRVLNGGSPKNVVSAYKMLRTRLLHRIRANNWNSIAITSASPGDGKTLTAINLAVSLAEEGNQNVFLIDLDMRNPSINKYLALEEGRSIVEYFTSSLISKLDDFVIRSQTECLYVIGNNKDGIEKSSELIFSSRMVEFLASLRELDPTGLFIFDLPPILAADDMLAFAPHTDAILLVVGEGDTSREHLAKAAELIKSTDFNIAGVVLNRSVEAIKTEYY